MAKKYYLIVGSVILFLPFLLRGQQQASIYLEKISDNPLNILSGKVFFDQNQNAAFDNEQILRGWFVKAENTTTGQIYWTATDRLGQYQFKLELGTYKINVITPNRYWLPFQQDTYTKFSSKGSEIALDFAMKAAASSPAMQVDVKAPNFQNCAENVYTIRYANNGTSLAKNAYIDFVLDASLTFVEASQMPQSQRGQIMRFNVGDVPVNGVGRFTVKAKASCSTYAPINQTVCSDAHIYPDTISSATIQRAAAVSSVVVAGANTARYSKNHIIIEDVIIFILPTNGDIQSTNQIDSSNVKKSDSQIFSDESASFGVNRLALQAFQTAYFDSYPKAVSIPSVFTLCQTLQTNVKQNESRIKGQLAMLSNNTVVIYPNPIVEMATFETQIKTDTKVQLLLFDGLGKLVRNEPFVGEKLLFHRKNLSSGVYFYRIMKDNTPLSTGSIVISQ
ncbi:MAG: T9SS type A sorting domain-containing protein [Saprospiraceae bacterium]|nr:T9SS type A sorting domain-containing protein [Saprospiraceae bacterium]